MNDKYQQLKDPGMRAFMIEGEKLYPPDAVNFTMAQQRVFYDQYCAHFSMPHPAGVVVSDFKVGAIACRRYKTVTAAGKLLYLHGGGYVVGGIASHDSICADLAAGAEVEVIAVEYRLAPEHPFPAAFDDCWQVLNHVGSCLVAGDSAGANLAAALCLKTRDLKGPTITAQILIYPGLGGDMSKGSYITQANAPGLSTADVQYYHDVYQGGHSKFAEPLCEANFADLPPAFIVAAGLDPLHDDATEYAARLKAAGVAVQLREEPLLVHAFLRARNISMPAAQAFAAIIAATKSFAAQGKS